MAHQYFWLYSTHTNYHKPHDFVSIAVSYNNLLPDLRHASYHSHGYRVTTDYYGRPSYRFTAGQRVRLSW